MENILSTEDVASILGYTKRSFQNKFWSKDKTNLPPAHKVGRKVYFIKNEVEQWLLNQPVINAPKRKAGRPSKVVAQEVA